MTEYIENLLAISPEIQYKILYSVITIVVMFVLSRLFSKLIINRIENDSTRYSWFKNNRYFTAFISIFIFIIIWLGGFSSLGTYIGLLSAGLAIALRDLLVNLTLGFL